MLRDQNGPMSYLWNSTRWRIQSHLSSTQSSVCFCIILGERLIDNFKDKDATDYFRAIVKTGEKSARVLELTETIIRQNPAHYSAWYDSAIFWCASHGTHALKGNTDTKHCVRYQGLSLMSWSSWTKSRLNTWRLIKFGITDVSFSPLFANPSQNSNSYRKFFKPTRRTTTHGVTASGCWRNLGHRERASTRMVRKNSI